MSHQPASRLTPGAAERIQEFLTLNRCRLRGGRRLSDAERARWTELRREIEGLLEPGARGDGCPERASLRVPTDLEVRVSGGQREETASAREIAEGGLFLATGRPLPVGTPLHLKLVGDEDESLEVEGEVVWVRREAQPAGPPGMGIRFENLDDSQVEAVAYLVEEALSAL